MAEAFVFLALVSAFLLFLALGACSLLAYICFDVGVFDVGYQARRGVPHG